MIVGLYAKSTFSFVKDHPTAFQSDCTICILSSNLRVSIALHPPQRVMVSMFWQPSSMWVLVSYGLICKFLTMYNVEYLFICLFAICQSLLLRYLLRYLPILKMGSSFSYWLSFKSLLCILDNSPLTYIYFFPAILCLVFKYWQYLLQRNTFNFNKAQFINFYSWIMTLVCL